MWFLAAVFVVSAVVAYAVASLAVPPSPSTPPRKPAGLGELNVPTAEEGREIPVIFGTVEQRSPNIVWYGDLKTTEVYDGQNLVGHRYYLGMHAILCHAGSQALIALKFDGKTAWQGFADLSSEILVQANQLFGGHLKEGGVSGYIDFEREGGVGNDYLTRHLDKSNQGIPYFKGVTGVVFKEFYFGTSPFLKKPSFRLRRTRTGWRNDLAAIAVEPPQVLHLYIAIDVSSRMGDNRLARVKTAIKRALDVLYELRYAANITVRLVAFGSSLNPSQVEGDLFGPEGLANLKSWIDNLSAGSSYNSDYHPGVLPLEEDWLKHGPNFYGYLIVRTRDMVQSWQNAKDVKDLLIRWERSIPDDQKAAMGGVNLRAIGIDSRQWEHLEKMDNTGRGPLTFKSSETPINLAHAIAGDIVNRIEIGMNPAHIIRECLTNINWGMGYSDLDIDDDSFTAAATTLQAERFGLSFIWDKETTIESFIQEVCKHIDATLFVDRETGKFTLKLIRGDYNVADLIHLDETSVSRVENVSRPAQSELVNTITVNYTDPLTGKEASVTVHDTALVSIQGRISNATIHYPGITSRDLATKVAQRDLRVFSNPRLSCTIYADRTAASLNVGDAFLLTWPELEIESLVMRVVTIGLGDGINNTVKITATEDIFALPNSSTTVVPPDRLTPGRIPTRPSIPELDPNFDWFIPFEPPYAILLETQGRVRTNRILNANPKTGFLGVIAERPSSDLAAGYTPILAVEDPAKKFVEVGAFSFAPTAQISEALAPNTKVVHITNGVDLNEALGTRIAMIGEEFVRIDDIDLEAGTITLGRGIFDTVPAYHPAGTKIRFIEGRIASDWIEHEEGEETNIRLLVSSPAGTFDLNNEATVQYTGRAARPYPPGGVKINGEDFPSFIFFGWDQPNTFTVSWLHRNRLAQAAVPYAYDEDAGVDAPEPGARYRVRVWRGGTLIHDSPYTTNSATVNLGNLQSGPTPLRVSITTEREGLTSLQSFDHTFTAVKQTPNYDKIYAGTILEHLRHWFTFENDGSDKRTPLEFTLVDGFYPGAGDPLYPRGGNSAHLPAGGNGFAFLPVTPEWMTKRRTILFNCWVRTSSQYPGRRTLLWHQFGDPQGPEGTIYPENFLNLGLVLDSNHKRLEVHWYSRDFGHFEHHTDVEYLGSDEAFMLTVLRDEENLLLQIYLNGALRDEVPLDHVPDGGENTQLWLGGQKVNDDPDVELYLQDVLFIEAGLNEGFDENIIQYLFNGGEGRTYQNVLDDAES